MAKVSQKPSAFFKKVSSSSTSADPGHGVRLLDNRVKALRRCRPIILKDLDPVDILDRLVTDDGLRPDIRDTILTLKTREERVTSLLDRLERSDEGSFLFFLDALRDRHKHLHSLLEEMMKTRDNDDDDDDDDNVKERAAIAGDVLRQILSDSSVRKRLHVGHSSCRGGSGSRSDPSFDNLTETPEKEETEGQYLPCYVVSTRGKMQREKWIRHANFRKDEDALLEPACSKTYMAVVMKDLVFRRMDRMLIPDLVKSAPSHCKQVYVIDEERKYSPTAVVNDNRRLEAKGRGSSFRSLKSHSSRLKRENTQTRRTNEPSASENVICFGAGDPVPPPLPPKPENLPQLGLFPGGRRHPDRSSPEDAQPEPHTSDTDDTLYSQEARVPPLPLRSQKLGTGECNWIQPSANNSAVRDDTRSSAETDERILNGASVREQEIKKEKSTDCDSAFIPLLCVHG